jgi:hypothetical protein
MIFTYVFRRSRYIAFEIFFKMITIERSFYHIINFREFYPSNKSFSQELEQYLYRYLYEIFVEFETTLLNFRWNEFRDHIP